MFMSVCVPTIWTAGEGSLLDQCMPVASTWLIWTAGEGSLCDQSMPAAELLVLRVHFVIIVFRSCDQSLGT